MLVRVLLQTSLVLGLAQTSLQGGVKPQTASWGRMLPARGVGIGVRPGVASALGAVGNRYGSKAMKAGIGRNPGAQLGVGAYRALGLGSRAGLRPGGYGTQGPYGASLGTGMGLGAGLTNGRGMNLGHGAKRVYGAGLGTLPGYGHFAGGGYPVPRHGVSPADLGRPEMANLGHAAQDLKREKTKGTLNGKIERSPGPEMPNMRRTNVFGATAPELQIETGPVLTPGREVKTLNPLELSSSLGRVTALEKQRINLADSHTEEGKSYKPVVPDRWGTESLGATPVGGGVRQQLPLDKDSIRTLGTASSQRNTDHDSHTQQSQWTKNCRSSSDLSDFMEMDHHQRLGSETQGLVPQPMDSKHLGQATPHSQEETAYRLPLPQIQDVRGNRFNPPQGQSPRDYLSAVADSQGLKDPILKAQKRPRIHGTVAVENLQMHRGGRYRTVIPGASGSKSLGVASRQEGLPLAEVTKSKAGRNTQATSYLGGAGNYLGANLGTGGYGPGLGQGAYLGGAAGKHGGYGDGATGYLGAMAGNGFGGDAGAKALSPGYGNGYGQGYGTGTGLGYPAELAEVAEKKAGRHEALGAGAYPGQGSHGTLSAGMESNVGKYGAGASHVPYGNAPVIPTGLEGVAGYPYDAQQLALRAEGVKTASKYGARQAGYGAHLGAAQEALGEQAGKYTGVNDALGNGYKG